MGAPLMVSADDKLPKPIDLAIKELELGILPITLKRSLPDETFVYIPLQKLVELGKKGKKSMHK